MPRLIDAHKIVYSWTIDNDGEQHDGVTLQSIIDKLPTVDAEPVRHGHWIYRGKRGRFPVCECSECGNAENADWAILGNNVNYCPNCGAKMDEVD